MLKILFDCEKKNPILAVLEEDQNVFDVFKVKIHHPDSSVCLGTLHPRISSSRPEAIPVMELSHDGEAVLKRGIFLDLTTT